MFAPRPGRWVGLAAATLLICSCGSSGPALPTGPPIITIDMSEYRYAYTQHIPSGRVIFRMVNTGHQVHEPNLFPLSDQVPPIDQQVRGGTRVVVAPYAAVLPRQPGQVGTFAVDLRAGQRYAFVCFARTAGNKTHASLGMAIEFRPK